MTDSPSKDGARVDQIAEIFREGRRDMLSWLSRHPTCAGCGAPATFAPCFYRTTKPRGEVRVSLCPECKRRAQPLLGGDLRDIPDWLTDA